MTPAHITGPASSRGYDDGILTPKFSCTTKRSVYPPRVCLPAGTCAARPYLSVPPYVGTLPAAHRCSSPASHAAHRPHESTMHPTPILSPTSKRVTSLPTSLTTPAISCPGHMGYCTAPVTPDICPAAKWRSLWHTPQYLTSMTTSRGLGARRRMDLTVKSPAALSHARHRTSTEASFARDSTPGLSSTPSSTSTSEASIASASTSVVSCRTEYSGTFWHIPYSAAVRYFAQFDDCLHVSFRITAVVPF